MNPLKNFKGSDSGLNTFMEITKRGVFERCIGSIRASMHGVQLSDCSYDFVSSTVLLESSYLSWVQDDFSRAMERFC